MPHAEEIPAAIGGDRDTDGDQYDRAARHAAFRNGRRKVQPDPFGKIGDFFAKLVDHLFAIEAEMVGIGAHESDRIGGSRKILETPLLNRLKMDQANAQRPLDVLEVPTKALTGGAQHGAHGRRNRSTG